MCGIGLIRHLDASVVVPDDLAAMAATLRHRGPDEAGHWVDGPIGLAHTRLSIIDLAASHQPMSSVDGRWHLVFNGEIFNYRELRDRFDYPYRTSGDTEVLLAGLRCEGIDVVHLLRGQFAFIAHDRLTGITHLVRDRLGILPLHYTLRRSRLVAASEVKAILAVLPSTPDVDLESLDAYLARRAVPAPHTLFAGIKKVPPGHRAEVRPDGSVRVSRYWSLPEQDEPSTWSPATAVEAVDEAVRDAVRASLVADVPVGSYLSGGVDSSLIVAVMAALRGSAGVQTFAAGFGDPRHDELPWARLVSEHLGTEHHEVHVRPDDFEHLWPRLTWHRDAPVSEPADIAVFRLAELARRHVRVVLSGEGGDELFAGYPKYRWARPVGLVDALPVPVRKAATSLVERRLGSRAARARIVVRAAGAASEEERFAMWFAPFTPEERAALLPGTLRRDGEGASDGPRRDVIARMLAADLATWLPDNLLERGDRMSMATSLELRPPLLDHRLVELAFRLPSSVKLRGGTTKWVLKEVARRYLPQEVVDRRKVGFRVPLDAWFRGALRDSVRDRLTGEGSFVAETLDRTRVRGLIDRHETGRFDEANRIWTLLCLEVWHETFFTTSARASSAMTRWTP
ncbi:asparagine synthase (glutamine-hydrolyzing) [uncultured Cellulomonas sp.]|uniref:asparagine synthase (glutamine-hydrolyzing) n=1 Tax=uncultured Cellulomonas sp. TaxID=189682 RepID=UPI00260FDB84|nr:asparagine synthase (glutamine-hydrolyzing) [uncultured Cellulomonas sp.]